MLPKPVQRLVQLLSRLPGVGEKTAQRYALRLISGSDGLSAQLGEELLRLAERIRPCDRCGNLAEIASDLSATCSVCQDYRRESSLLCVVARIQDLMAIERSGVMRGRYFVLGRLLSPLDGVGAEELPLAKLSARIRDEGVSEVILATPPSVDGEATALLLGRELANLGVKISRIASGVPHGGEIEYVDQVTLGRAINGRRNVDS